MVCSSPMEEILYYRTQYGWVTVQLHVNLSSTHCVLIRHCCFPFCTDIWSCALHCTGGNVAGIVSILKKKHVNALSYLCVSSQWTISRDSTCVWCVCVTMSCCLCPVQCIVSRDGGFSGSPGLLWILTHRRGTEILNSYHLLLGTVQDIHIL